MASLPTRILIVEDNPDDEALLLRQLRKAQLDEQVKVIADGGKALDYLRDAKHKCEDLIAVFLDLQLPTLGGLQILEAIRGMDRIAHLPVILMTSTSAEEELERCRELGVSSYVNKPVTFATFARAVANSFHARKPAAVMVRVISPQKD
jgi:two-component system response regulator